MGPEENLEDAEGGGLVESWTPGVSFELSSGAGFWLVCGQLTFVRQLLVNCA